MAFARSIYPADGLLYNINFSYLDASHVKVYIDGDPYTNFTFINFQSIQLAEEPSPGSIIIIQRETPKNEILVDFQNASILTEHDLDTNALQLFFGIQEAYDQMEATIKLTEDNKFDARNIVIKNLAEPQNPNDAATLNTVSGGAFASCQEQANIATQKAVEASDYASQAVNSAIQAGTIVDYEGATEPSATHPLMKWHDTSVSIIKVRNLSDNGWIDFIDTTTGCVLNSFNVTTNINGHAIADILEPDGVTVKKATSAESAETATNATKLNNQLASYYVTDEKIIKVADSEIALGNIILYGILIDKSTGTLSGLVGSHANYTVPSGKVLFYKRVGTFG